MPGGSAWPGTRESPPASAREGRARSRRPVLRTNGHTRGPAVVHKHRWILKVKLPKHFALQHPEVGGQQVAMPARGICVKRAHAIWSSGSRGPFPAPQPPNHWCHRRCPRGPPRGIGGSQTPRTSPAPTLTQASRIRKQFVLTLELQVTSNNFAQSLHCFADNFP